MAQKTRTFSIKNVKKLQKISTSLKLPEKALEKLGTCEVCCKAKQARLPFKIERSRAKRSLQLIHTDLCGPIDLVIWNERKYILTFIDDYTHYTMIYLLRNKYEVTDALINYVNKVEGRI